MPSNKITLKIARFLFQLSFNDFLGYVNLMAIFFFRTFWRGKIFLFRNLFKQDFKQLHRKKYLSRNTIHQLFNWKSIKFTDISIIINRNIMTVDMTWSVNLPKSYQATLVDVMPITTITIRFFENDHPELIRIKWLYGKPVHLTRYLQKILYELLPKVLIQYPKK